MSALDTLRAQTADATALLIETRLLTHPAIHASQHKTIRNVIAASRDDIANGLVNATYGEKFLTALNAAGRAL